MTTFLAYVKNCLVTIEVSFSNGEKGQTNHGACFVLNL